MTYHRDPALWIFGTVALAALIVSAPATFAIVSLYHNDTTMYGLAATIALVVILEAGTVASKLATLAVTSGRATLSAVTFAGLTINAVSNLAAGVTTAAANGLTGLPLWIGGVVYAALVPLLTYVMLSLFVRRVETLRGQRGTVATRVATTLEPVQEAVAVARALSAALAELQAPAALPVPVGRPADTATRGFTCRACGQSGFATLLEVKAHQQGGACVAAVSVAPQHVNGTGR